MGSSNRGKVGTSTRVLRDNAKPPAKRSTKKSTARKPSGKASKPAKLGKRTERSSDDDEASLTRSDGKEEETPPPLQKRARMTKAIVEDEEIEDDVQEVEPEEVPRGATDGNEREEANVSLVPTFKHHVNSPSISAIPLWHRMMMVLMTTSDASLKRC
jgi:hypothetical protein